MIHTKITLATLLILNSTCLSAANRLAVGEVDGADKYHWHQINTDMNEQEYRRSYKKNQKQIRNFVEDYSESTLMSLGIPKKGVHLMGAVAGAAITQDATFYLNSGKSLAIDIKDAGEDDRAVYFGVKLDW